MKKNIFRFLIFASLVSPIFIYSGEKIILKNGKVLIGNVVSQQNGIVNFKDEAGQTTQINTQDVVNIQYVELKPRPKPKPVQQTPPKPKETTQEVAKEATVSEKNTVTDKEKIIERTEKVTVDKELTDKVMQKFEDADKRRSEATKSELQILKEELDYIKKEKEKAKANAEADKNKVTTDKRLASAEVRIRRLEKYLNMDESMVEYYMKKRSPWDPVWRSALVPGWGHRYTKDEYTGNVYTTSILILIGLGYFINYQAGVLADSANTSLATNLASRYLQTSAIPGLPTTLSQSFIVSTVGTYENAMNVVNSQRQLAHTLYGTAVFLYLAQIVHSYFTGVEWTRSQPRDYSKEELMKPTSWNFKTGVDRVQSWNGTQSVGTQYNLEIIQRF